MKHILSVFLFILLAGAAVFGGSKLSKEEKAAVEGINVNSLNVYLSFLQSDLLKGRQTGDHGNRVAAGFIASMFEKFGVKAGGENGTYFQSVRLQKGVVQPETRLVVRGKGDAAFEYQKDFILYRNAKTDTTITAPLVFVGYGIQAPEYDYDDFKEVDIKKKIVVFFSGEPESEDTTFFEGPKRSKYASSITKSVTIKKKGALGFINLATPENDYVYAYLANVFSRSRMSLEEPVGLKKGESTAYSAAFFHSGSASDFLKACALDYDDLLSDLGSRSSFDVEDVTVEVKLDYKSKPVSSPNVIGLVEGSDLKDEYVVLTAHFDHVGVGEPVNGDSIYNGAVDNASGTACLMSVAEAFAGMPVKPRRSLLFIACTAEEEGLLGSKYFVGNPTVPLESIVANINMDVMASGDTTSMTVIGFEYTTLGDMVWKWGEFVGANPMLDQFPEQRFFERSDNYSFSETGIPSISPSAGMTKAGFTDFLKYYHKPGDQLGQVPLSFNALRKQTQAIFLTALEVANAAGKPQWKEGRKPE